MDRLEDSARQEFLDSHAGWAIDGESLSKTFAHKDFKQAMAFVTKVALASEVADHHPDIDIRWNKVRIVLSTHDAGALTSKDTALASEFDAL